MTSIPASRRARAMILAPRSWPSRPGLAITTRIFRATVGQVYGGAFDRRWLLTGLAEPRRRTVRLPRRERRRAALAGLRARRARSSTRARGLAARRLDRDHALPSRPLGRPRAVGVGPRVRARARARATRAVGSAARQDRSLGPRSLARNARHVRAGVQR